jgi:hypothetical protein
LLRGRLKTSDDVLQLSDIEDDVKKAFSVISNHWRNAKVEAERKIPQIQTNPFSLNDGPTEIVAIDGSYAPVYRMSSLWVVAVRAVALTCEFSEDQGYSIKACDVNEGAQLVTTDKDLASEIDQFAIELQSLTAKRPGEAPKRMATLARILGEFELASMIARKRKDVTIVLDGTLTAPPVHAIKAEVDEMIDSCARNGNTLVGISKDSNVNLFGLSIADEELLQYVDEDGLSYVIPPQPHKTALGPKGLIFFVKYHPDAPKWFRTDVISKNSEPADIFGRLAQFARSQLCLGYIYPLAEAHKAAVELRRFPELYDDLLFRVAAATGIDPAEIVWGRTNIDGRRRDAFHAYLDMMTKSGARKR